MRSFVPGKGTKPRIVARYGSMPRPPRDDIHPIIQMRDMSKATRRASEAINNPHLGLLVYPRDERYLPRVQVLDSFHHYCTRLIQEFDVHIDHEVLNRIAFLTQVAVAS